MLMDGWKPHSLTSYATCMLCINLWLDANCFALHFLLHFPVIRTTPDRAEWVVDVHLKRCPALFKCFKGSGCRQVFNFACHHVELWLLPALKWIKSNRQSTHWQPSIVKWFISSENWVFIAVPHEREQTSALSEDIIMFMPVFLKVLMQQTCESFIMKRYCR